MPVKLPELSHEEAVKRLTLREEAFIGEYLIDKMGSRAVLRAGYTHNNPAAYAQRLLKNPVIKEEIRRRLEARNQKLGIDAEWVLREAVETYRQCKKQIPVLNRDGDQVEYIDENGNAVMHYTFDSKGALMALALIGKHIDVDAFVKSSGTEVKVLDNNGGPMALVAMPIPTDPVEASKVYQSIMKTKPE